jgi:hypothetical protein
MTAPDQQPKLIHVRRPLKRVELSFEPSTPPEEPIADGPLIQVGHPMKRVECHFEPVALAYLELALPLLPGVDGEQMFGKLNFLVGKLNEMEALFDRPGMGMDGERSGVRDRKIVIVLTPNDLADGLETCKRIADQLFAALRPVIGVTVTVIFADQPEKPVYQLAP